MKWTIAAVALIGGAALAMSVYAATLKPSEPATTQAGQPHDRRHHHHHHHSAAAAAAHHARGAPSTAHEGDDDGWVGA